MNPYLRALQQKYDKMKASITGLQERAVQEERALTDEEMRSVTDQGEQLKQLAKQIEDLTAIEQRNAKVAELGASLLTGNGDEGDEGTGNGDEGDGTSHRSLGAARTRDRDPGHYRQGGDNSFFADMYRSRYFHDADAERRLHEHQRALSTGTQGAGVVPPKWLTEEFDTLARQGRYLANAVRNIPLGDDPRPLTLPKQTAGTDDVVDEQVNENDPVDGTDAWDSDVDTVSPKPTSGKQIVARQMIDMSNPAIDQLIYGDLLSVYNLKVENKVGAAVRAIGSALTATGTQFSDMTTDGTNGYDLAVDAGIAVRKARKLPAQLLVMTVDRYGEYLKLKDAQNRPLIPDESAGPMNVAGVGSVNVDGRIKNLGVIATDGMEDGTTTDHYAAIRPFDTLLFESNMLRFRFEEVQGPESVVLGIWGYTAVLVRQGNKSVKRVEIDTTV